ncbi:MAG: hypothetical protein P8Y24_08590 [Gammaproteobacteria bacterium]
MKNTVFSFFVFFFLIFPSLISAEEVTKEQIKGLDEQVQEIKQDVLAISAELNQLEEKLIYPSDTQLAFFVSVEKGSDFEPDAIKLKLNGEDIAHYIYSYKEVEAMHRGGVQRVFVGNVRSGEHKLDVSVIGKDNGSKTSDSASHTVKKRVGPQIVEIKLSASGIRFNNW